MIFTDRYHQASADLQLRFQRFGDFRTTGGNNDGVKRRLLRQAEGAVGMDYLDVFVVEIGEHRCSMAGEFFDPLYCVNLAGYFRQHRSRITRASANIQHLFSAFQRKAFGHKRDDIGLRDGLVCFNR